MLYQTQAYLKNAQVPSIFQVDHMTQAGLNRLGTYRKRPDIKYGNSQSQAGQTIGVSQHGPLQVKTVAFHIAKQFFNPHSTRVSSQSHTSVGQIGRQAPRAIFTNLPIHQQIHRKDLTFSQQILSQPNALTGFLYIISEISPFYLVRQAYMGSRFLAQDIIPMPIFKLFQHFDCAKFAITDQQNRYTFGQKGAYIAQQLQLGSWRAMP